MHKPLLWKCGNPNHPAFEAQLNSVSRLGTWCRECWEERKGDALTIITMDDLHSIAAERQGLCLSTEYKNKKILNGHVVKDIFFIGHIMKLLIKTDGVIYVFLYLEVKN